MVSKDCIKVDIHSKKEKLFSGENAQDVFKHEELVQNLPKLLFKGTAKEMPLF